MSPALAYRFSGFLAIDCMTIASTYGPSAGLTDDGMRGSSRTC